MKGFGDITWFAEGNEGRGEDSFRQQGIKRELSIEH